MRVYAYNFERFSMRVGTAEPVPPGLLTALRSHGWFGGCDERFQLALLAMARLHRCAAGETLFVRGGEPEGLCCVVAGAIRLGSVDARSGTQRLWHYLEPYQWFGEVSVLDGLPRLLDAVADQDSSVLVVPTVKLEAWLDSHPQHWRDLSRLACNKLRWMMAASEDRDALPVAQQVARSLVLAASHAGQAPWGHWRRRLRVPQDHLASLLGVSRQTINRALRALATEGLIRLGYAEIEILQLEGLLERSGAFDPVIYPGLHMPPG